MGPDPSADRSFSPQHYVLGWTKNPIKPPVIYVPKAVPRCKPVSFGHEKPHPKKRILIAVYVVFAKA